MTVYTLAAVFLPVNGRSQQRRARRGVAELLCLASSGEACSADSSSGMVDRRGLLSGGLALAAATALQSSLPANAGQVVSSDWEKVDLPVDPGVVLLDIGFTSEKHGARHPVHSHCVIRNCLHCLGCGLFTCADASPVPQNMRGLLPSQAHHLLPGGGRRDPCSARCSRAPEELASWLGPWGYVHGRAIGHRCACFAW